jgi:uncharacterized protein (DUF1697 family)
MLPMKALQALCAALGWNDVRTYIQSGNVVFDSPDAEPTVRTRLEAALAENLGRPVGVLIRTGAELRATLEANPFPDAKPAQVGVIFLPVPVAAKVLAGVAIAGQEEVRSLGREVFVHYPDGMGRSKLKLPFAAEGTMRNLNTVARLLAMTADNAPPG